MICGSQAVEAGFCLGVFVIFFFSFTVLMLFLVFIKQEGFATVCSVSENSGFVCC